jgi:hypothetical protein
LDADYNVTDFCITHPFREKTYIILRDGDRFSCKIDGHYCVGEVYIECNSIYLFQNVFDGGKPENLLPLRDYKYSYLVSRITLDGCDQCHISEFKLLNQTSQQETNKSGSAKIRTLEGDITAEEIFEKQNKSYQSTKKKGEIMNSETKEKIFQGAILKEVRTARPLLIEGTKESSKVTEEIIVKTIEVLPLQAITARTREEALMKMVIRGKLTEDNITDVIFVVKDV